MRRHPVAEGPQEVAELLLGLLGREPEDLEDAPLDLRAVDPDAPAPELEPVQREVVGSRLGRLGGQVVGQRRRERMVVRHPLALVVRPVEQRRLGVPTEPPRTFRDQPEPIGEMAAEPVERDVRAVGPVRHDQDEVAGAGSGGPSDALDLVG